MTIDLEKTIKELKSKRGSGRKTHGLYVKTSVLQAFKKACSARGQSYSEVIEHWMIQALEKIEKNKK